MATRQQSPPNYNLISRTVLRVRNLSRIKAQKVNPYHSDGQPRYLLRGSIQVRLDWTLPPPRLVYTFLLSISVLTLSPLNFGRMPPASILLSGLQYFKWTRLRKITLV